MSSKPLSRRSLTHVMQIPLEENISDDYKKIYSYKVSGIDPLMSVVVGGQKSGLYGFHARRAREGAHQPIVYTLCVVDVHARQEADGVV